MKNGIMKKGCEVFSETGQRKDEPEDVPVGASIHLEQ